MNAKEYLKESKHRDDYYSSVEYIAKMMEEYAAIQVKTCNKPAVSVSLLERAEMLISDTHEHWHNDYNRWRNER